MECSAAAGGASREALASFDLPDNVTLASLNNTGRAEVDILVFNRVPKVAKSLDLLPAPFEIGCVYLCIGGQHKHPDPAGQTCLCKWVQACSGHSEPGGDGDYGQEGPGGSGQQSHGPS